MADCNIRHCLGIKIWKPEENMARGRGPFVRDLAGQDSLTGSERLLGSLAGTAREKPARLLRWESGPAEKGFQEFSVR